MRRSIVMSVPAVAAAAVLVVAAAASAHPALRPGQVPAGATTEAQLVVPHGCADGGGMPEDGGPASPTTELAMQPQPGVEFIPIEVDGWTTSVEEGLATWVDDGAATTDALLLPVEVIVAADVALGELPIAVYQACANGESFRWQADEGEEGWPALRMEVIAADATAPPAATAEPTMDHGDMDMATASDAPAMTDEPATPSGTDHASAPTTATPSADVTAMPASDADDGGLSWWVPLVGLGILALAAVPVLSRLRGGPDGPAGPGDSAGPGGTA
jgi:hypothetical protein